MSYVTFGWNKTCSILFEFLQVNSQQTRTENYEFLIRLYLYEESCLNVPSYISLFIFHSRQLGHC